jgi:hypothetical protein
MDELAGYNQARWNELVRSDVEYSRPWLDLDEKSAREKVDPYGMLKEIAGKDVLCLASGGGQQSAPFGVLGAQVTVFDLSDAQLEGDRLAAVHYGIPFRTIQGDIRDLSPLEGDAFDIVYEEYSLEFVPDGQSVRVKGPKEYRHTFSTLLNGLIWQGFVLLGIWEVLNGDLEAEPGSWTHFQAFAPPYLKLWARYRPEVFE